MGFMCMLAIVVVRCMNFVLDKKENLPLDKESEISYSHFIGHYLN